MNDQPEPFASKDSISETIFPYESVMLRRVVVRVELWLFQPSNKNK